MFAGVCFIVLIPLVRGVGDPPRPARSVSDALVWTVLSGTARSPEPPRPRTTSGRAGKKSAVPDVEVVRSVEMEFDAVLRKLVPVREKPEPKPVLPDMHLLTQKTYRELKKILRKFEKERRARNRAATGAKIYRPAAPDPVWSGGNFLEETGRGRFLKVYLNNWENGVLSPPVRQLFDG